MNFESLAIVTYGRTGSTLLMGVLNSADGMLIRGENMGLCTGLFAAYKSMTETKTTHGKTAHDSSYAFFGAGQLDDDTFFRDAGNLLRNQLVPEGLDGIACWGFKEIRYTPNALRAVDVYQLSSFLDFMARLMPKPCFTFLTRNHDDVAKSGWWNTKEKSHVVDQLNAFEREAHDWSSGRSDCYWIDYANLVGRDEKLVALFEFLGARYEEDRVDAVMSREHSYAGKAKHLANVQRRDARNFEVRYFRPAGVHLIQIDKLPGELQEDVPFEIGGIVLLEPDTTVACNLCVQGSKTEPIVKTSIQSPRYARTHPDIPNAPHARFLISGLSIKAGETVDVQLSLGDEDPATLFSIEL